MRRFDDLQPPAELRWGEGVHFLGEHDGPPERELKVALSGEFLRTPGVRAAYLARVRYGGGEPAELALCIRSVAPEDVPLVGRVGRVYGGKRPHLDVLFLDEVQEAALAAVCPPFYRAERAD